MLTIATKQAIEAVLQQQAGCSEQIDRVERTGGGCINNSILVYTKSNCWFVKFNDSELYPGMFEAEARGLELLKSTNSVSVPDVIGTGTAEGDSFLILQAVIAGRRTGNYSEALGRNLAKLHRNSSYQFGLDHNNYIGSLSQSNKSFESGVDFFINERIRPMVASARDKKYFSNQELESFNQLYKKLPSLLPAEPPALLHGDLWNGNVITGPDGHAWLIDPAIYYGHRETDLAMAQLFGGFYDDFYDAYNEAFPLTPGWKKRVQLFQLYPLLVHLNLFGRGYLNGINQILVQLIR